MHIPETVNSAMPFVVIILGMLFYGMAVSSTVSQARDGDANDVEGLRLSYSGAVGWCGFMLWLALVSSCFGEVPEHWPRGISPVVWVGGIGTLITCTMLCWASLTRVYAIHLVATPSEREMFRMS